MESVLYDFVLKAGVSESIVQLFSEHPYLVIFLCLLVGGGIIVFPAFYLSLGGFLSAPLILGTMVLATVVTDTFWYAVGRGMLPRFMESWVSGKRSRYGKMFADAVVGRELLILFYSKFVFGTRIAAQLLSGSRKVKFTAFILTNIVGVLILGSIYYGIVQGAAFSLSSLPELRMKLPLMLVGIVLSAGLLHYGAYRLFKKASCSIKNTPGWSRGCRCL